MATYRTIRMSFWNDPAIESLPPADKLLYLYLFTCPHANNLGVLSVSLRKMAFETQRGRHPARAGGLRVLRAHRARRRACLGVRLHPAPVQHLAQNPDLAPGPFPHGRVRSYPGRHSGTLPAPVRGRAVPFR